MTSKNVKPDCRAVGNQAPKSMLSLTKRSASESNYVTAKTQDIIALKLCNRFGLTMPVAMLIAELSGLAVSQ